MVYSYKWESDGRLTITRKSKPANTQTLEYWKTFSESASDKAELKATIKAAEAERNKGTKAKEKAADKPKKEEHKAEVKREVPPTRKDAKKEEGKAPRASDDGKKGKETKSEVRGPLTPIALSLASNLTGFLNNIKSGEPKFKELYTQLRDKNTTDAAFIDVKGTHQPGTLFFATALNLLRQTPAFKAYVEATYSDPTVSKTLLNSSIEDLKKTPANMELAKKAMRDFFTFERDQGYVFPGQNPKIASDLKLEMPGNFNGDKMLALAAVMYLRRINNQTAEVLPISATIASTPGRIEPKAEVNLEKKDGKEEKKPDKEPAIKPPEVIVKPDHPIIFVGIKPDMATDVYAGVLAQKFEVAADPNKLKDEKIKVEHRSLDKISDAQAVIDQAPKGSTVVFVVTARDFFTQSATAPLPEDKRKQFTDAVNELSRKAKEKGVEFLVVPALYGFTIGYTEEKRTAVANGNTALQNTLNVTSLLENGLLKSGTAIMALDQRIGGMPKPLTTQELGRLLAEHFRVAQTQATKSEQTVKQPENKGGEEFVVPRR